MKNTREHNQTSAPKYQIIIKENDGGLQVATWMQYLGLEEEGVKFTFKLKETMQGWKVVEAIRNDD